MTDAASSKFSLNATHVSLFVAALSLCTAMYQGYLNTQAVGVFSRDVTHRETMRSCREAVEYFMEAELRIERLAKLDRSIYSSKEIADMAFDAHRTVSRFAAVATYLANFNAARLREPYTLLARELDSLIDIAQAGKPADTAPVEAKFYQLNENCVASATPAR
jgi:hypothetical protein